MKPDTLLIEIRTEELPPPAVSILARRFPPLLLEQLEICGFTDNNTSCSGSLATPRRFAALLDNVLSRTEVRTIKRRGPQLKDCYDGGSKPSAALRGFMRSVGETDINKLGRESVKGKDYIVWNGTKPGIAIHDDKILEKAVSDSLMFASTHLPAMCWDAEKHAFIRPVRGLIMMHGERVIDGKIMGVQSGNITRGHPALADRDITIANAEEYKDTLRRAYIIVDNNERKNEIYNKAQVSDDDGRLFSGFGGGTTSNVGEWGEFAYDNTDLCEYPKVYRGTIDKAFWDFPPECVESCLIKHHKCLPFFPHEDGRMKMKNFFFVADNAPENPNNIINGINAVVRARLRDVGFYMDADNKMTAKKAWQKLDGIVYHQKLGNQRERAERIISIATAIGGVMNLDKSDKEKLRRAAEVCKLDLPTMMVGEYPELAGIMASMYFCKVDIVHIVKRHCNNDFRFLDVDDDTALPSIALFLADKLEKIVGMFIIGEKPAGRKDPHGLRRAAGQIADMLAPTSPRAYEMGMPEEIAARLGRISITELINIASGVFVGYDKHNADTEEVRDFIARRIQLPYYVKTKISNAVNALRPDYLAQIPHRCNVLRRLLSQPQAGALIAANKRINNILRKSSMPPNANASVWSVLLHEDAEKELHECIIGLEQKTEQLNEAGNYEDAMELLAAAAAPIDAFFDKCMVNDKDDRIRENRLALLLRLQRQLNAIADLSML